MVPSGARLRARRGDERDRRQCRGYAALTLMPASSDVLTVEYKLSLVASAAGDHLEALGTVLKAGRTLTVCRLEVFAVTDDERKLVAAGQQT